MSLSEAPLISVLMTVYNAELFLAEACQSLLQQTYPHFEVIAVNDGSSDGSQKILEAFASMDSRFRVVCSQNQGPSSGRNLAFTYAQGELIAIVDSDDICKSNRLEKQLALLQSLPTVKMVGAYYKQIDSKGRTVKSIDELPTDSDSLKEYLHDRNPICHGTVMMSRDIFAEMGGYRPVLHQAEDYDLFLRIIQKYDIALVPEILYCHRIHENSLSTRKRLEQLQMRSFVMQLHRERMDRGVDRLSGKSNTEQVDTLKCFLAEDLLENRRLYCNYLSEVGRKYYRIGESGAALHNLKTAIQLAFYHPRTLRYFVKAVYRKAESNFNTFWPKRCV